MGWNNYKWAWNLRGVTPSEQLVCLRLADEANARGVVDKLSHNGLQRKIPGLSRRTLREIIRKLHIEKCLIKTRIPRKGARGQQISNSYELNLKRFHPPDDVGTKLWKELAAALHTDFRESAKFHSEGSSAYYDQEFKLLSVFVESKHALRFFDVHHKAPQWASHRLLAMSPPVHRLEFILPGYEI